MTQRAGTTLLEIIIATALFAGMLVMLLESMMSLRGLASTVEDIDILEEQAELAKRTIESDFINSGWYYCQAGANGRKFYPQIHISEKLPWHPADMPIVPSPVVTVPKFDPMALKMVDTEMTASVNKNQATFLGDAVVFARLQSEGQSITATPSARSSSIVNFSNIKPMRLNEYEHARSVQSLIINPASSSQSEMTSVLWETSPTAIASGLNSSALFDDNNIRLFAYRVIPDPATGRGQLTRFYSNPGSGDRNTEASWTVDQIIATDVISMHVYSFEMAGWYAGSNIDRDFTANKAAGLTNNQLHFVIEFARNLSQKDASTIIDLEDSSTSTSRDNTRARSIKTLQFTIGLRSITNSLDQ